MLDLKIINGTIVDVENGTTYKCDVGIKNGKIEIVGGNTGQLDAKNVIDAEGKFVSPGFIDIHMHEEDYSITNGEYYDLSLAELRMGVTTCVGGNCGSNRTPIKKMIDMIAVKGYPTNYMCFIGHNALRESVGVDRYEAATKTQIERMKQTISEYMKLGTIGVSYGLEYSPGVTMEETTGICKDLIGRDDLLVSIHFRRDAKYAMESLQEMRELTDTLKIPLQISHISSLCAFGNMEEGLTYIKQMIDDGLDVMADAYPYGAFMSRIGTAAFDDACFENWEKGYDAIILAEEPYKGLRCDKDLFYAARENYPNMYAIAEVMNEDEIKKAFCEPFVMVGSDGGFNNHRGHPRGAGTFARCLGRYSIREHLIPMVEMIQKMTIIPAKRLKIDSFKGFIKEGYDADVVIFDKDTVIDVADFNNPYLPPVGIEYVIVGGTVSVEKGVVMNERNGRYIKRKSMQ